MSSTARKALVYAARTSGPGRRRVSPAAARETPPSLRFPAAPDPVQLPHLGAGRGTPNPSTLYVGKPRTCSGVPEEEDAVLIARGRSGRIDVPGESLRCVIIDKLPFARLPIWWWRPASGRREKGGDPFTEYQVPEAVLACARGSPRGAGRFRRRRSSTTGCCRGVTGGLPEPSEMQWTRGGASGNSSGGSAGGARRGKEAEDDPESGVLPGSHAVSPRDEGLPEMLPLVDKPLIQHGVEEAKAAGIRDMIIVTGRGKNAIEDHFDVSFELEATLAKKGDGKMQSLIRSISDMGDFFYVRQNLPLGLGHAVLRTEDIIGEEPAVARTTSSTRGAGPAADDRRLREVQRTRCWRYRGCRGNTSPLRHHRRQEDRGGVRDRGQVEKPKPDKAPPTWRSWPHILPPSIFPALRSTRPGAGGTS